MTRDTEDVMALTQNALWNEVVDMILDWEDNGAMASDLASKIIAHVQASDRQSLSDRIDVLEGDESGWLIEEDAGGIIHWIALAKDAWRRTEVKDRRLGARNSRSFERYLSPVVRVKSANEALRFARKLDAEAFIQLFDRFLLCATATEHEWPARAALHQEATAP